MAVMESGAGIFMRPAHVISVYPEHRTVDVKWIDTESGKRGVIVVDAFGNLSFPDVGDQILVFGDGINHYCVGKLEYAYQSKIEGKTKNRRTNKKISYKEVPAGATYLSNIFSRAWLSITNSGDFSLFNGVNEGFKYLRGLRSVNLFGRTIQFSANGIVSYFGTTIRDTGNGPQPVSGAWGGKAIEAFIQMIYNKVQTARFHIGDVTDIATGTVPVTSVLGGLAKALIEVTPGGKPGSHIIMDDQGNIDMKATTGKAIVDSTTEVQLGGTVAVDSVIKGTTYVNAEDTFITAMTTFAAGLQAFATALQSVTSPATASLTGAAATTFTPIATKFATVDVPAFTAALKTVLSQKVKTA